MRRVLAIAFAISSGLCMPAFAAGARSEVLAKVRPSVVIIKASLPDDNLLPGFSFPGDTSPESVPRQIRQMGTGFVIDGTGLIVTAVFNVENASEIVVTTADGRNLPATLAGSDEAGRVAVLRIAATDLPPLAFCATPPQVGDDTLSIGIPYGVGLLAYQGMVSGTEVRLAGEPFSFLALDMTTLRGMAGAPILSPDGCVTGMAVAQIGAPGTIMASELGIAVPAAQVQAISRELIATGHVARSWIGLQLMPDGGATSLTVLDVEKGGPADRAGIRRGDVIVSYDGRAATSSDALIDYLMAAPVGSDITFGLRGGGGERVVKLTTAATLPAASQ